MATNKEPKASSLSNSDEKPQYMDALKKLSVIHDRQDKYSISLGKYINLEDYHKGKRGVTRYEIIEKPNSKFEVIYYNHDVVVERLKGVVCDGVAFQIPRSRLSLRGCYLYNVILKFSLFK